MHKVSESDLLCHPRSEAYIQQRGQETKPDDERRLLYSICTGRPTTTRKSEKHTHLSEAAEHLRDSLGDHGRLLPQHEGHAVVRPREKLVLLRKLHAGARGCLELANDPAPLYKYDIHTQATQTHTEQEGKRHTHTDMTRTRPQENGAENKGQNARR